MAEFGPVAEGEVRAYIKFVHQFNGLRQSLDDMYHIRISDHI